MFSLAKNIKSHLPLLHLTLLKELAEKISMHITWPKQHIALGSVH
jgi:hypothetical protein